MNILLAGPCGVGKTAVAPHLGTLLKSAPVDFDDLRGRYLSDRGLPNPLAFSVSKLDLMACLPAILKTAPTGFVLAVGSGTVFHPNADNNARLVDVRRFREACSAKIVVMTARKDALLPRYTRARNGSDTWFEHDWDNWLRIEEPYWDTCKDFCVDTSELAPRAVAAQIAFMLLEESQ